MMDWGRWAFANRKLVYFLVVVLLVGGGISAWNMSKLEDPEVTVKLAMVVTAYPGASAHQVEMEVTDPLEKSIRLMDNVHSVESHSFRDLSLIQVELHTTVSDSEVGQHWNQLRHRVSDAVPSLPRGASAPMVKDDFGHVSGMFYALTADGLTLRELTDYAEMVKRELLGVEGVERIDLYGTLSECIHIDLWQDRMAYLGVTPAEVLSTLNGHNQTTYAGNLDSGDHRISLSVSDNFHTVEQIGNLLLQGHEGDQLRLSDIARVEKSMEHPVRNELLRDGTSAVGLLVAASPGTDITKVGADVEACIDRLTIGRLPSGVVCHKIFFQPDRVEEALGTFLVNLVESVAIVVVVLMLTMGFRSGLIIGFSLLVIVLGSFLLLGNLDGTMQRVSLGAFILAMGMLVDNAIVIIDGILVDIHRGVPRMQALTAIGRRTALPLLGATSIAIIAFLPIYLSPDTAGVYTRDLFVVLCVSLLLSWLLALTHVPLMADFLLPKDPSFTQENNRPSSHNRFSSLLARGLRMALSHRWVVVGMMLLLLVLTAVGYGAMRHGFFPDMEYDQLYMEYKLPEGYAPSRVKRDLADIEAYLKTRPEVLHVTTSIGATPGRYNLVRSIATPSLAYGELIVDFTSSRQLVRILDEIQEYLTRNYPEAYVKLKRYNLMFKKYPIEAQFQGPDPAVLHRLADSARAVMDASPLVHLVTTDWSPQIPSLVVDYDQAAARALRLSRSDVSLSILSVAGGIPVGRFYEGFHPCNIYLRSLSSEGTPVSGIGDVQVFPTLPNLDRLFDEETLLRLQNGTLSKGEVVRMLTATTPLRQVCRSVDVCWEDPVVPRYNGQRSQRVQCSPVSGVETEKARSSIAEQIERIPLPEGYTLTWQGERQASTQSMKYLFRHFPLAIVLMVAILILLFKDYRKPAIILCSVPLVMVGVVLTVLLTGKVFNFVAIVGALGLVGMIIKNGIVLMDEITLQIHSGKEPVQALVESTLNRFRPVSMAALTTILGMIPLLSDAMFGSMAAAIMGGLFVGTFITLIFIPVLYSLFFNIVEEQV